MSDQPSTTIGLELEGIAKMHDKHAELVRIVAKSIEGFDIDLAIAVIEDIRSTLVITKNRALEQRAIDLAPSRSRKWKPNRRPQSEEEGETETNP